MGKRSRRLGLVVSLALVVAIFVGTISAQAAIYRVGKYDIYFSGYTELTWARNLARYVPEAWRAAYTVIGNRALNGQMQVRFYSNRDNIGGYMYSGTQKIYLNRYNWSTYQDWGATLAHETSHVLFYNYTKASYWNRDMLYYTTWITESLARYTGDVAYRYAQGQKWSARLVKSELKKYSSSYRFSFYGMGYYYRNGSGNSLYKAILGQRATAYMLTGGRTYSTSSNVARLMYTMKRYSSYYGSYLRSSNFYTARYWFEYTFKYATGYSANAGLYYGKIYDRRYLMGKFYYQWYV